MRDLSSDISKLVREGIPFVPNQSKNRADYLIARLESRLTESEKKRSTLLRDNDILKAHVEDLKQTSASRTPRTVVIRPTAREESISKLTERIESLNREVLDKEEIIEHLGACHDAQIRKIEELNVEEVDSLRHALSVSLHSVDKWKAMYTEDISHGGKNFKDLHERPFTCSRVSTLGNSRSCSRL